MHLFKDLLEIVVPRRSGRYEVRVNARWMAGVEPGTLRVLSVGCDVPGFAPGVEADADGRLWLDVRHRRGWPKIGLVTVRVAGLQRGRLGRWEEFAKEEWRNTEETWASVTGRVPL